MRGEATLEANSIVAAHISRTREGIFTAAALHIYMLSFECHNTPEPQHVILATICACSNSRQTYCSSADAHLSLTRLAPLQLPNHPTTKPCRTTQLTLAVLLALLLRYCEACRLQVLLHLRPCTGHHQPQLGLLAPVPATVFTTAAAAAGVDQRSRGSSDAMCLFGIGLAFRMVQVCTSPLPPAAGVKGCRNTQLQHHQPQLDTTSSPWHCLLCTNLATAPGTQQRCLRVSACCSTRVLLLLPHLSAYLSVVLKGSSLMVLLNASL
jgi:hypothetical protein